MDSQISLHTLNEIQISYSPKRLTDVPKIDSSISACSILRQCFNPETISLREECFIIYLDRANKVLGTFHHSVGGLASTLMDIRHIMAVALKSNASGIIMSHNHPSGALKPSKADVNITKKFQEAGKFLDILILDHIILTADDYTSMADE